MGTSSASSSCSPPARYAPLKGYLAAADLAAVTERGELADGTPWPLPVTLAVPGTVPADAGRLVLQDPKGHRSR